MRLLSDDRGSGTSLFAKKDLTLCEKYSKMKQIPAKRNVAEEDCIRERLVQRSARTDP